MPLISCTDSAQSLISWAWLSCLPNRPAGQRPGCSGEAPWHLLRLSLPAGKQQRRSQPRLSLVTAAHSSPVHVASGVERAGSCPFPHLPSHLTILRLCPTLEAHAPLPSTPPFLGGSQRLRRAAAYGTKVRSRKGLSSSQDG